MIMQLPPAQMANQDGDAGMETMLWDFNIIPWIPHASSRSSTYECLRTFHPLFTSRFTFQTLAGPLFCVVFWVWGCLLLFVVLFPVLQVFGIPNSPRSLDLDDRQGFIASSAMQQKKTQLSPP